MLLLRVVNSNDFAFAALSADGAITSWGGATNGGVSPQGLTDVTYIFNTVYAFAALQQNGTRLTFNALEIGAKTVKVKTTGNLIDEGREEVFQTCRLAHKVDSSDPSYQSTAPSTKTEQIINDDVADVRLWMIHSTTKGYTHGVRFIRFFVQEGQIRYRRIW